MSRIENKFLELQKKGEKALIGYIMAGYPNEKDCLSAISGLIKGGIDIIEVGFPFSDPLADGPIIQNASTVALTQGTTLENYFKLIAKIREKTETPIVLMTYSNVLFSKNFSRFLKKAKKSGIDGIILPDMSIEESKEYIDEARKNSLDTIFLISPNTTKKRLEKIAHGSSGFLYLVAIYGTTGMKTEIKNYTITAIKNAKKIIGKKIPIGIGFGISSPKDVKKYVSNGVDAVIVGSSFLELIKRTPSQKIKSVLTKYTKSLKKATKP